MDDKLKVIEADIHGNYTLTDFTAEVNGWLNDGYQVSSTNCCVIGANDEGSFSRYQAILVKRPSLFL